MILCDASEERAKTTTEYLMGKEYQHRWFCCFFRCWDFFLVFGGVLQFSIHFQDQNKLSVRWNHALAHVFSVIFEWNFWFRLCFLNEKMVRTTGTKLSNSKIFYATLWSSDHETANFSSFTPRGASCSYNVSRIVASIVLPLSIKYSVISGYDDTWRYFANSTRYAKLRKQSR